MTDLLGYAAAALVLATFSVRSIVPLRLLAIASNVMFIGYAAAAGLVPVLLLHAALLPINAVRLVEAIDARRTPTRSPRSSGTRSPCSTG